MVKPPRKARNKHPPSPSRPPLLPPEDTCDQVVVETGDNAISYYSGIYDALGKASGRTRFVRVDNRATLEFSFGRGREQQWMLTGLQTTIAVGLLLWWSLWRLGFALHEYVSPKR